MRTYKIVFFAFVLVLVFSVFASAKQVSEVANPIQHSKAKVKPGQGWVQFSESHGFENWQEVRELNRDRIRDYRHPNLIYAGQVFLLPIKNKAAKAVPRTGVQKHAKLLIKPPIKSGRVDHNQLSLQPVQKSKLLATETVPLIVAVLLFLSVFLGSGVILFKAVWRFIAVPNVPLAAKDAKEEVKCIEFKPIVYNEASNETESFQEGALIVQLEDFSRFSIGEDNCFYRADELEHIAIFAVCEQKIRSAKDLQIRLPDFLREKFEFYLRNICPPEVKGLSNRHF